LQHENEEVTSGFHAMVERVFLGNVESQVKAVEQHSRYRTGTLAYIFVSSLTAKRDFGQESGITTTNVVIVMQMPKKIICHMKNTHGGLPEKL